MLKVNHWFFLILFTLTFFNVPFFNSPEVQAINSSSQISSNSGNYTAFIINSTLDSVTYKNQKISVVGISTIEGFVTFSNCSLFFSDITNVNSSSPYPSSGFFLTNNSSLTISDSYITYASHSHNFHIVGLQGNNISIINSHIICNPSAAFTTLRLFNAKTIFISQNTFSNFTNLFSIQHAQNVMILNNNFVKSNTADYLPGFNNNPIVLYSSNNIFLSGNSFTNLSRSILFEKCMNININDSFFTNFNTALYFSYNNTNISISKCTFINGTYSLFFEDFTSSTNLNCTINNFYMNNPFIFIKNFNYSEPLTGTNFSENYYANFQNIDFNNDGFYDNPFTTRFFIDSHPLSYPFENYIIYGTQLVVNSNYRDDQLVSTTSDFHFFGLEWSLLIIFYALICIIPLIMVWKFNHKKLKRS